MQYTTLGSSGRALEEHYTPRLVIVPFAWSDGTCGFCREGLQTSCRHGGFWNANGVRGAQAEAIRVPLADGTLVTAPAEEDSPLIPRDLPKPSPVTYGSTPSPGACRPHP